MQHGERACQRAGEVVEEQLAIHLQASLLDALGRGCGSRVAQVRGETSLQLFESIFTGHRVCFPAAPAPASACTRRIVCTSRMSMSSGGMLKSRSSTVGLTPQ